MNLPEKLERDAMDSMPDMVLKMWNKTNETLDYLKEREADKQWSECNACFDNEHDECEDERCECPHKKSSPEAPQEKECDNCKIEDGGIIRLTNERMCADCGRDMSILSPSQEKECKHNWIGYSSTERMECTKCGEKSSPSQQIDVKALLEEYATSWDALNNGYTPQIRVGRQERMSEIEEIIKNNLK